ncbi:MAG: hypothetical protein J5781_04300 [Clostridia bacterium]|nr:hypothetical protein [Clostridia bacterium]
MNVVEGLLWKRKNGIMSSIYQNTFYKGQKLCDFFKEPAKTRKEGRPFNECLCWYLLGALPKYDYQDFIEKRIIYEKYPHLFIAQYSLLIKIKELLDYFDGCADQQEVAVGYLPCSLLRPYRIFMYDKSTKTERIESIRSSSIALAHPFVKLFRYGTQQEILESLEWNDYQSLLDELKAAR